MSEWHVGVNVQILSVVLEAGCLLGLPRGSGVVEEAPLLRHPVPKAH